MRKVIFLNIALLLVFSNCATNFKNVARASDAVIKGRVVYQNHGLQNVNVCVYQKAGAELCRPCLFTFRTDENGSFSFDLKQGIYCLLIENGDYFGYFGGNPVNISHSNVVDVVINCIKKHDVKIPADEKGHGISGVVYYEDAPIENGEVFFYLDMRTDLRGPAYFSVLTDKHGYFHAPLESGTYYLVCRKRMMPEQFGPIQPGDFFGYCEANPISLQQGENQKVVIYVLKRETVVAANVTKTVISGNVYDIQKRPVSGIYVCLYKEDEMVGKPEYISNKTGEDGVFQINPVSGGKFYLIAKENFGDVPKANDFIGYLANSNDHSVEIATDKSLTNLEIIGEKILSR